MKKLILISICVALFAISCNSTKSTTTGEMAATAKEVNPSELEGIWELNYLSGTKISYENLYTDKKPFLSFNIKDSRVSGNSSCNSFTGNITLNKNYLRFDDAMAMTKMFCAGEGESSFMDSLKKVNSYSVSDNGKTLNLLMGDIAIMRFHKK